ncbi:MAG: Methyltransferase type 11 [Bacteroidota bacterium]|nr:Methyltransferase type 11 [Bacteroidota bacterium]
MSLLSFLKTHLVKGSPERLDLKYKTGHWDYLREIPELAHYSIIAGYFQFLKKGGSVLDIGCGEGLLQERIGRDNYSGYSGFDLAAEGITRAKAKEDDKTSFAVADMNTYTTSKTFDVIIFNEVIYYSNVLNTLIRYSAFLKPDGIFILSNFSNQNEKIGWEEIYRHFHCHDETTLFNKIGSGWVVKVLQNKK